MNVTQEFHPHTDERNFYESEKIKIQNQNLIKDICCDCETLFKENFCFSFRSILLKEKEKKFSHSSSEKIFYCFCRC